MFWERERVERKRGKERDEKWRASRKERERDNIVECVSLRNREYLKRKEGKF